MSDQSVTNEYINILRNLPFEIITVPQDRYNRYSNVNNTAHQSFKIKIKRKAESRMKCAAISVPKLNATCNAKKVRTINSDQTIVSFDLVMDTSAAQNQKRNQNKFFHIFKSSCLKTQNEDESFPYVSPSPINLEKIQNLGSNDPKDVIEDTILKNPLCKEKTFGVFATNPPKSFLGQCKPGGCLDPPYGEDNYPYTPTIKSAHESLQVNRNKKINTKCELIGSADIKTSITNKSEANSDELSTNVFKNSKLSTMIDQENSLITYPHIASNGKSNVKEDKQNCTTNPCISLENRSSMVNKVPITYYMPPKRSNTKSSELKYNKYDKKTTSDAFRKINIEIMNETTSSTSSVQNRLTVGKDNFKRKPKQEIVSLPGIKQEIDEIHSQSATIKLNEDTYMPKLDDAHSLNTTKIANIDSDLLSENQKFQTMNMNQKDELETFKIRDDIHKNGSVIYSSKFDTKEKLLDLSVKSSGMQEEATTKDLTITHIKDLNKSIPICQHPSTDNLTDKAFDPFPKKNICQDIDVLYEDNKLLDISPKTSQDIFIDIDSRNTVIENNVNNLLDNIDNKIQLNIGKYTNKNSLIMDNKQSISETILIKKEEFTSKLEDELSPLSIYKEIKLNTNDKIKKISNLRDGEKLQFTNQNNQLFEKSVEHSSLQLKPSLKLIEIEKDDKKSEKNNSSQNLSRRSLIKSYSKISILESPPSNYLKDSNAKINTRIEIYSSDTNEKKLKGSTTTIIQNKQNVGFTNTDTGYRHETKSVQDKVTTGSEDIQTQFTKNEQVTNYEIEMINKGIVNTQLESNNEENKLNYENAKDILKNTDLKDSLATYGQKQYEIQLGDINNSNNTISIEKHVQPINVQEELDFKVDSINVLKADINKYITPLQQEEIINKQDILDYSSVTSRKQSKSSLKECEKENYIKKTSDEINTSLRSRDIQSDGLLNVIEKNYSNLNHTISFIENRKSRPSLHFIQVNSEDKNLIIETASDISFRLNSEKEHEDINKISQELEYYKYDNLGAKNRQTHESSYVIDRLTDVLDEEKDSSTPSKYQSSTSLKYQKSRMTDDESQEKLCMQTISSITVNLGFRTVVDNKNSLIVQTYDPTIPLTEKVQDCATSIQAIIKESDEIRIPIKSDLDLSLRISKNTTPNKKSIDITTPEEFDQNYEIPNSEKMLNDSIFLQETLNSVYEILISIHDVIKNLSEEAYILSQQEMFFAQILNKMETKPLRILNNHHRCECKKKL